MLAARADAMLDLAGPDRTHQAEAAITVAGGRASRRNEPDTTRRHAEAVLHLLWVGGQRLAITPGYWPDELANTVLAATRRADVLGYRDPAPGPAVERLVE